MKPQHFSYSRETDHFKKLSILYSKPVLTSSSWTSVAVWGAVCMVWHMWQTWGCQSTWLLACWALSHLEALFLPFSSSLPRSPPFYQEAQAGLMKEWDPLALKVSPWKSCLSLPIKHPEPRFLPVLMNTIHFWNQSVFSALISWYRFLLGKLQSALNSFFLFLEHDLMHLGAQISLDLAAFGFFLWVQGPGWTRWGTGEKEWGSVCDRCPPHSSREALLLRLMWIPLPSGFALPCSVGLGMSVDLWLCL